MPCPRCHGLLVHDYPAVCFDDDVITEIEMGHCLNCGLVLCEPVAEPVGSSADRIG